MRNVILSVFAFLIAFSCKAQNNHQQQNKVNNMFETFDYDKFEKENEKYKDPERSDIYLLGKGREIWASWRDIYEIPSYPYFYLIYKEFYEHPNQPSSIKEKGKYFGDISLGSNSGVKIEKWYYFDEKGKLIREVDEDKKFGKFSYNDVLKFLDNQKDINLNTGEGRNRVKIEFYNSEKLNKKLWQIKVKIGEQYGVANLPGDKGMRYAQDIKSYYLDGETGEIIKGKKLSDYREIIPNFTKTFPDL